MLKLLVFVSISAKIVAFAWASEQEVACTQESTVSYYNDFLRPLLQTIYPGIDDDTVDAVSRFYGANDADNGICLYNQISTVGKENILTSLYFLLFQLSQLASCADESLRTQILNVMNMASMEEANKLMPYETNYFGVDVPNNYSSTMEYLIMADIKRQFTVDFTDRYTSLIPGQTKNMDFGDSSTTANYFNEWMKQDGCDLGYEFLSSEETLDEYGLHMGSKNWFIVYWHTNFRPLKKVSMEFYESDGNVVETEALHFEGYAKYKYDESLKAKVIEMPLAGDYKLRVVQPDDKTKIKETIFRMRSPSIYISTFESVPWTKVKLTIPLKQDICASEDFVPGLKLANLMPGALHSTARICNSGFEDGSGVYLSHMYHTMRLSFRDAEYEEDAETDSEVSGDSDSYEVVEVNSPYTFDIMCFADTRMFSGVKQKAD